MIAKLIRRVAIMAFQFSFSGDTTYINPREGGAQSPSSRIWLRRFAAPPVITLCSFHIRSLRFDSATSHAREGIADSIHFSSIPSVGGVRRMEVPAGPLRGSSPRLPT